MTSGSFQNIKYFWQQRSVETLVRFQRGIAIFPKEYLNFTWYKHQKQQFAGILQNRCS